MRALRLAAFFLSIATVALAALLLIGVRADAIVTAVLLLAALALGSVAPSHAANLAARTRVFIGLALHAGLMLIAAGAASHTGLADVLVAPMVLLAGAGGIAACIALKRRKLRPHSANWRSYFPD